MTIPNNKELRPLEHYTALYRNLDITEVSTRTCAELSADGSNLTLRFFCKPVQIAPPSSAVSGFITTPDLPNTEKILLLRYLLEGRYSEPTGGFLAFREFPKAAVYNTTFQGRCVKRFTYAFANKISKWSDLMQELGATPVSKFGDAAFDWAMLSGFIIRFVIWEGDTDDAIAPAGRILFSDNFVTAFSAEDLAVIGDITINRMKAAV
jgi:hypothetical protein